jgi:cytoskeletal protein RodZ
LHTLLSDKSPVEHTPQSTPSQTQVETTGLGLLLTRARERRGLTLQQISNETKIPRRHLEALEHDDLAAIPGGFYRRAEIRAYARAVDLDEEVALAHLERATKPPPQPASTERQETATSETPAAPEPTFSRQRLLIAIGIVVTAAILGRVVGSRVFDAGGRARLIESSSPPSRIAPVQIPSSIASTTEVAEVPQPAASASSGAEPAPDAASTSGALPTAAQATTVAPEATAAANPVTSLVVTTQPPGGRVTVNGIGWGEAPVTIRYLEPGDKRIRVTKDGYAPAERVVSLGEGGRRRLDIQLRSEP